MSLFDNYSLMFLVAALAAGAAAEFLWPMFERRSLDAWRWIRAVLLATYGNILVLSMGPLTALGSALVAARLGIGLFHWVAVPLWLQIVAAVLLFDLTDFLQHRALHRWRLLWRCHRTHHSDIHVDASTALRFHPFEFVFRSITQVPVILAFGLPPEAIVVNFVVTTLTNVWTHLETRLPACIERALAAFLILPRTHRLHHSDDLALLDTNFGSILNVWDRLSGTYRAPQLLTRQTTFGVGAHEAPPRESLSALLTDPVPAIRLCRR